MPSSSSSSSSSSLLVVDDDTRRLLLQKTWCHGQLVLPAIAVWYFWLFLLGNNGIAFLYATVVLPWWSWYSWNAINGTGNRLSPRALQHFWMAGLLVESAHLSVLVTAYQQGMTATTINLFLVVASSLFLIETAAFLAVVGMCGRRSSQDQHEEYNQIV